MLQQRHDDVVADAKQQQRPVLSNIATDVVLERTTSQQTDGHPPTPTISASEAIFDQLQKIQKLQDALFDDHLRLEKLPSGLPEEATHHHNSFAASPSSSSAHGEKSHHGRKHYSHHHASSPPSAHRGKAGAHHQHAHTTESAEEKNKKDIEAYDRLAERFADREGNIESMMQKLAELSEAVKHFHSLPPPVLFPETRHIRSPASPRMVDQTSK